MAIGAVTPKTLEIRNKATVFQWNACGLWSRLPDFRRFIQQHRFPIIAISETRLRANIRLSGYTVLQSRTGEALSRVLLAIRNDLTYMEHTLPPDDTNEYVTATIKSSAQQFTLIAAYIPPDAAFNVDRLQHIVRTTPAPHVLTGDFNAHHPSWGSIKTTIRGRRLFDAACRNGLAVINTGEPTFSRGAVSSTLDVTMVSLGLSRRAQWYVDIESHGSDHLPTYILLDGLCGGPFNREIRCLDWSLYSALIEELDGNF